MTNFFSILQGNSNKSKQLTRSHAMKETTSPPRTPTAPHSPHSPNDNMKSLSPSIPEENCSQSGKLTPTFVLPPCDDSNAGGKSQMDIDFPKLTPPKQKIWNTSPTSNQSKSSNNANNHSNSNINVNNNGCGGSSANIKNSVSSPSSGNNESSLNSSLNKNNVNLSNNMLSEDNCESQNALLTAVSANGDNNMLKRSSSSTSQTASSPLNSSSSSSTLINCDINKQHLNDCEPIIITSSVKTITIDTTQSTTHDDAPIQSKSPNFNNSSDTNNNSSNKYNSNSNNNHSVVKNKPPLRAMGSSSSVEGGGTSSGFISRDSSSEQFVTDQSGVDLVQFFKETLNKNAKDRNMLIKIERELCSLASDPT